MTRDLMMTIVIALIALSKVRNERWLKRKACYTLLKRDGGRRVMVRVVISREMVIKWLWLRELDPTLSSTARIKRSG